MQDANTLAPNLATGRCTQPNTCITITPLDEYTMKFLFVFFQINNYKHINLNLYQKMNQVGSLIVQILAENIYLNFKNMPMYLIRKTIKVKDPQAMNDATDSKCCSGM